MKLIYSTLLILLFLPFKEAFGSQGDTVTLSWLDKGISVTSGITWGVPWPKGAVKKNQEFILTSPDGKTFPLQTWPLAYWPDGSLKWSAFSTIANPQTENSFRLIKGKAAGVTTKLNIVETAESVEINTGAISCIIPKSGQYLIQSIKKNQTVIAEKGHLACSLENTQDEDLIRIENFTGNTKKVTLEQNGPVRSVVKIEGMHKSDKSSREWLPFIVRLYFYAGQEQIRMVHTIVFDGNEKTDFIHSLGIVFDVPMREETQNRQVRFSGEDSGLWSEPVQPMIGRGGRFIAVNGRDVYPDQIAGKRVPNKEDVNPRGKNLLEKWPVWNDYKLVQPNADGFTILKRTNDKSSWLPAGAGKRSSGLACIGDATGGLAVGLKNFWQSYPASLEIKNAGSKTAQLKVWLWSPDAPSMDLRHYDTIPHGLEELYEDVQEGFSTPNGVARTSELTIFVSSGIPAKTETAAQAMNNSQPPLLVCSPQYLHDVKALGIWSLPDRSTPFKKAVEEQLDQAISYYQKSVDQHNWYGFWDFGDFMHSYDNVRHEWRYDLGGMAWDNSELGTDMWLWTSFLRTGRADIFRMAEAMTRHTGEVDCYHLGRFAGLGSRHNVRHWGCGAKEARISQAAYRRFYYYLTADERTGDLMRETLLSDKKATEYDPMRLAQPITEAEKKYPGRVRVGPDWFAFAGNWMTEWERTGNKEYRDKIITGMKCLTDMPYGIRSGRNLVFGYDSATNKLFQLSAEAGDYNLSTIMGGAEVMFELNNFINYKPWDKAWLQFCRLTSAPADSLIKDKTGNVGNDGRYARPDRLAAYAYMKTKNPAFAKRALSRVIAWPGTYALKQVNGPDAWKTLEEAGRVSTNDAAQSSLIAIEVLEMCADQLPTEVPKYEPPVFQRRREVSSQSNEQN